MVRGKLTVPLLRDGRSTILLLSHIPLSSANPIKIGPGLVWQNNLGVWFNAAYVGYYFMLEPFAAVRLSQSLYIYQ
jgi:hypothetical protein